MILSLQVIHKGELLELENLKLDDIITLEVDSNKLNILQKLNLTNESLETRLRDFARWMEDNLTESIILKLFRNSSYNELITFKENILDCSDKYKVVLSYLEYCIEPSTINGPSLPYYSRSRLLNILEKYFNDILTLSTKDFVKLDRNSLINGLLIFRKSLGISRDIVYNDYTLNFIKYDFKEYNELFTLEVIKELIKDTVDTVSIIGIPSDYDLDLFMDIKIPIVLEMMYNADPINTEAFLLSLITNEPRSEAFIESYIKDNIVPLRNTTLMEDRKRLSETLSMIVENNINIKVARDLIFGEGFLYIDYWENVISTMEIISESDKKYKPIVKSILEILPVSDILYNKLFKSRLKVVDEKLSYLKASKPKNPKLMQELLTTAVTEWNVCKVADKIDYDESSVIINNNLNIRYIEKIISKLDTGINRLRFFAELF